MCSQTKLPVLRHLACNYNAQLTRRQLGTCYAATATIPSILSHSAPVESWHIGQYCVNIPNKMVRTTYWMFPITNFIKSYFQSAVIRRYLHFHRHFVWHILMSRNLLIHNSYLTVWLDIKHNIWSGCFIFV